MTTSDLIVSYSGIRGIFGVTLTADVVARYGAAFGRMIVARHSKRTPTILLGRDTRTSGPALFAGAVRGLSQFGTLVDLGVVATPTLQHALGVFDAEAALCITASHNPAQWNGLKLFLAPERVVLDGPHMKELRALAEERDASDPSGVVAALANGRHDEAVRIHVERVCAHLDVERIRAAKFRVAVDSGAGAGEEVTLLLLDALGCTAVPVHCARESEPLVEHLGELRRAVVDAQCDLGVAQDLDADRLALVAEDGHAPGEELTLVLAVDHLLARTPSSTAGRVVVKNVSTSCALDDVVKRRGARLMETAVGEVNLSRAIAAERAAGRVVFGGEGNGGVIFPELHLGRDSLIGIGLVLERLATTPRAPLSAHLAAMPRYYASKRKVAVGTPDELVRVLARVEVAFAPAEGRHAVEVSRLDGLRVRFADGSWIGVRPSNTEPVVRIVAESRSQQWADENIERLAQVVAEPDT